MRSTRVGLTGALSLAALAASAVFAAGAESGLAETIGRHERTGRPLGDDGFVEGLEEALGRVLRRQRPGPKPRRRRRRR